MKISKEGIYTYFLRHFHSTLLVKSKDVNSFSLNIASHRRIINVSSVQPEVRTLCPSQLVIGQLECRSGGFRVKTKLLKVNGGHVAKYAPGEVQIKKPQFKIHVKAFEAKKEAKKNIVNLPQERYNRIRWLSAEQKLHGHRELNLAYFFPLIEANITKIVLNKQSGKLLVWYNPQGRLYDASGLYMYRRLGGREIEWKYE